MYNLLSRVIGKMISYSKPPSKGHKFQTDIVTGSNRPIPFPGQASDSLPFYVQSIILVARIPHFRINPIYQGPAFIVCNTQNTAGIQYNLHINPPLLQSSFHLPVQRIQTAGKFDILNFFR